MTIKNVQSLLRGVWAKGTSLLFIGLVAFGVSAALSFCFFREWGFSLSVNLAKVQFKDSLAQSFSAESEIKPAHSSDITATAAGSLDQLLANTGDLVKRDQILGVLNEAQNRAELESALALFKSGAAKLARAKAAERPALDAEYQKRKLDLEAAKRKLETSLVRAPADGFLWLGSTQSGAAFHEGDRIGQVEDRSGYVLPIRVPAATGRELTEQAKVTITPSAGSGHTPTIEALAQVRYASAKVDPSAAQVDMEIVVHAGELLSPLLHQKVHLEILMRTLQHVALVEPKAIFSKDGDPKILVLNSMGGLHWQRVGNAGLYQDQLIVKGVDPKSFRVVLPENPALLNKAITFNVRPKVNGS